MNENVHKIFMRVFLSVLSWMAVITLTFAGATLHASSISTPVTKVVSQYALTSANDFPQRDPQDWRLLGSNDGGKTWVVLDIRTGEFFSERHQRRVFTFINNKAFNIYRLQIDRVRDPATADAVQLARIELMGESENDFSPTPLFCDLITAQGENPPAETAYEAFDDQVETKWLDTANQHSDTRSSWIQWQYLNHAGLVITNISQLLSLQTRASEGYPVQIESVLTGQIPGTNKLGILDTSGYIEVEATGHDLDLPLGQRVLLEGVSQWKDNQVGVRKLQFQTLEPKMPDKAAWIKPGQSVKSGEEFQWAQTEGQIQFLTRSDNGLKFDLVEDGRSLSVCLLHLDPNQEPPSTGTHVRASGLYEGVLDENGNRVAGTLWTPNLDAISPVIQTTTNGSISQQALNMGNESLITQIDSIRHLTRSELANSPKVKVRGVVTGSGGTCVQDGTGGIEIWADNQTTPKMQGFGAYIEVEGRAVLAAGHGVAGYGPVIMADEIHFLGNGKLPNPARPSWSLLASGQMDAQWVEVDAVVRATDGSHLLLACESGQLMATISSAPVSEVNHLVDATIRVRGVSFAATDERGKMQEIQLVVPSLEFIEMLQAPVDSFNLPPKKIDSLLQVRGPRELIHRVKINGVLTCFGNNNYFIQDNSGGVMAVAKQDVVLSLPVGGWWSFWQSPKTNTSPEAETELKVGDEVEVIGFPETRGYAPVLTQAILRKVGKASPLPPIKTTVTDLAKGELDSTLVTLDGLVLGSETLGSLFVLQIQSDQKVFQAFLPQAGKDAPHITSGSRIRITGVCQMEPVINGELGKSPSAFSLLLRNASDISLLELPPWLTIERALLAVGALVVTLFGAFIWIRLLHRQVEVRTQQLKQEIAQHEKTEGLLDRKTKLLQREIKEHEQTEATLAEKTELLKEEIKERKSIYIELEEKKLSLEREIEERRRIQVEAEKIHKQLLATSRMAGMADVATNVLHNVGNVLNGVNVLAASIATHVQKSKVPGVSRLAALLAQHQADLARFMTDDANGKHVPGHLERLGTHLTEEQSRLLERMKLLTESIQHIKEIVAMQQNYAKISGVWETVLLSEIVEDALKMCGEALARHEIKVVRDFEETPPATLDRHKVLQILFNLLDNAKHACEKCDETEKQITVTISRLGNERVRIEVSDNGIGIPPENLIHIFTQGFSTRKEGHGFGLHSSILAAQDMGGSLAVHSDGPGKGAAFILEIPLMIQDAAEPEEEVSKVLTS
jgi:signal transduction histidine kinase